MSLTSYYLISHKRLETLAQRICLYYSSQPAPPMSARFSLSSMHYVFALTLASQYTEYTER